MLIEAWDNQTQSLARPTVTPKTAEVTDNSDGSYEALYTSLKEECTGYAYISPCLAHGCSVSKACRCPQVSITFRGVYAKTPAFLTVNTDKADPQRTYVYGRFLNIRAGTSSAL